MDAFLQSIGFDYVLALFCAIVFLIIAILTLTARWLFNLPGWATVTVAIALLAIVVALLWWFLSGEMEI